MNKNTRKITIENKVTTNFEQMKDTAKELETEVDKVYCGYLRQEIHTINRGDFYQIDGKCALSDGKCYRFVSKGTQFNVEWCPEYQKYFKEDKNE